MSDENFKGGGTPIGALQSLQKSKSMPQMQQQQPPPQMQQQQYPPQMQQMTPEMQQQMMMQQHMMQQQQQQQQQQQYQQKVMPLAREKMKDVDNVVNNFASMCKDSWKETIVVIVLSILTNNGLFYEFQNRFIPEMVRSSFVNVIVSALVSGIIFFLISQFILKRQKQ
jgi:hypothetical protein